MFVVIGCADQCFVYFGISPQLMEDNFENSIQSSMAQLEARGAHNIVTPRSLDRNKLLLKFLAHPISYWINETKQ